MILIYAGPLPQQRMRLYAVAGDMDTDDFSLVQGVPLDLVLELVACVKRHNTS